MITFYFTATGNSLAVAKRIGGNLIAIPQVIDTQNPHYKDDVIGIVFPIYSNAPPKMVRRFLENARLEADYIFAVGTYGNLPGACMFNLQKTATKNGFRFDYTNQILMVDNYLPIFEMDAEIAKLPAKKTEEMNAKIAEDIALRKRNQTPASWGWRIISGILGAIIRTDKNAQKYTVNEECTTCGICAKVCPAKNIAVADKVEFGNHCEACLACAHLCPQNAIHLKKEKSGKRWRNPDVSTTEIINSNNRHRDLP
ncbi:EFR1 family ferrodoxin [Methanolapillus ohkumae]|uniref:4Fe-4S ferredoxin-type domain-containing protein n=1 Tax=Methanolapillus ohkumae TaxID=3028298 RepID=A0AA96ZWC1_9EURY|nr:hypothetical protein MsAm2_01820 [Methanosarcinaceae archaeon Am2]